MIDLNQVHPVTDFVRNYKAFLTRIKETGNPEVLTVNGKPEYVVLDAKSYQQIADELERNRFVAAVKDGIREAENGLGKPAEVAYAEMKAKYDL